MPEGLSASGVIPVPGFVLEGLLFTDAERAGLFLGLYLMWQACQGKEVEWPWIGPWARRQMGRWSGTIAVVQRMSIP